MEHKEEITAMLHQIPSPAFLADSQQITAVNTAAKQYQLTEGLEISPLLLTGKSEFAQLETGRLYLTLTLCGTPRDASVTALGKSFLFVLEQEADQLELRSMALAAQVLRTPLASVMSTIDRLFPLSADTDPELQDQVGRINRNLYQMLRVICNMSDAYRYESESVFRGEIRDIDALIREHLTLAAPLVAQAGFELHYTGLQERIYCMVDVEKLERAISNILSNAMKFAPMGSGVNVRLTRHGRTVYLCAYDDGPGNPPKTVTDLYSAYRRAPGLEDGRFGLGLGMVMIRSAAAAHGGTVLTEQSEQFGMRLTMSIPIRQASDPMVRTPVIHVDYAGELDHLLLELADCLPPNLYQFN